MNIMESPERILRLKAVKERTGLSRSSIYVGIGLGSFPAPISLSARAIGFLESEVSAWIAARIHASRNPEGNSERGATKIVPKEC